MALILPYKNKTPLIGKDVFLASNATLIGDVELGDDCSVWFGAVIRGDVHYIRIGKNTNIQDLTVIHVTNGTAPTIIGSHVTIGHNVTVHGGEIGDFCLIGMGSVILDNAVIEPYSIVAAGAVVKPGTIVKSKMLYAGIPAKQIRSLSNSEILHLEESAGNYVIYKNDYLK